jgi:thiopurine S-methyltransferase
MACLFSATSRAIMDPQFWRERWQQSQIGFHLDQVNPLLVDYWSRLKLPPASRVFVPLCGKTLDLVWLAGQGHQVVGVECSELAVQSFFEEQRLSYRLETIEHFNVYHTEDISIFQGDYFRLDAHQLGKIDAVYDRAALIAMPENMRPEYAGHLLNITPQAHAMLLITLQYLQAQMSGPPFSVTDDEVKQRYENHFHIDQLSQVDVLQHEPRFRERGLGSLHESVFLLTRR